MTRGKKICNHLKAVRQQIAEENGIPFELKECTHTGDCRGTCPRCEAEVRYLERELSRRLSVGKAATVAGLTLSLVACGGSGGSTLATDTPLPGDTSLPASGTDSSDDESLYLEGLEEEPEVSAELGIVEPLSGRCNQRRRSGLPRTRDLMVEPTESEPIAELDRFVDAMSQIRKEIKDIEDGKAEKGNNIISHAPYTAEMLMANEWNFPFTRKEAGFPMKSDVQDKYFPHVTRIDDAYGDRNLVCKFSAE